MVGIWTVIAAVASFVIAAVMGKWLVPFLRKVNFGQTIREEGPKWHQSKQGTPTMGGFMFIASSLIVTIVCVIVYRIVGTVNNVPPETTLEAIKIFAGLFLAFASGFIGFIDDYIKVVKKRNLGLNAKQKLILQFLSAIAYLVTLWISGATTETFIPFVGMVDIGLIYWPLAAIVIVGIINAVNLTDGIDGLNGSVTFFAAIFFMLIAGSMARIGFGIAAAALAGGCLGFLMWNFHPAKVFMGDTGSLFLGGYVCALAFGLGIPLLLLLIGFIYLAEMFSVILQVTYFKLTKGKRLFKMSPIHHHFEMCKWSEVKIVTVFSFVTIVLGAGAFVLVLLGTGVL